MACKLATTGTALRCAATGILSQSDRHAYSTYLCERLSLVRISGFLDIKFDIVDTVFGTAVSGLLSPS